MPTAVQPGHQDWTKEIYNSIIKYFQVFPHHSFGYRVFFKSAYTEIKYKHGNFLPF